MKIHNPNKEVITDSIKSRYIEVERAIDMIGYYLDEGYIFVNRDGEILNDAQWSFRCSDRDCMVLNYKRDNLTIMVFEADMEFDHGLFDNDKILDGYKIIKPENYIDFTCNTNEEVDKFNHSSLRDWAS